MGSLLGRACIQGNTVPFSGYTSIISEIKEGETKTKVCIQVIFEGYPHLWAGVEKEKENTHSRS